MIVAYAYDMIVYITEPEHLEIMRLRDRRFRPLFERERLFRVIYARERTRLRSRLPPLRTFYEWLQLAYENYWYYMYKRYQVVKLFYQHPQDVSRKSPYPFADVRAWHFYKFEGEEVDEEVEIEKRAEYINELREECHFLTALFPSIIMAYLDGAIAHTKFGEEATQVDEDEVTEVCTTYRAALFYRHIPELVGLSEQEIIEFNAEELRRGVGVYLEEDIREFERAFRERFYRVYGYYDKRDVIRMVKEEQWADLLRVYG